MNKHNYITYGVGAALSVSLVTSAVAASLAPVSASSSSGALTPVDITPPDQASFPLPAKPELLPKKERYLVRFKQMADEGTLATNHSSAQATDGIFTATDAINLVERLQGDVKHSLPQHRLVAAEMTAANAASLKKNPHIELLERDPKRFLMAETAPWGIAMVEADQLSDADSANIKVCIMDTGYDRAHEDLRTDDVTGDDGYSGFDSGDWWNDGHGHGTHVAGTIAAIGNNDTGVVGVNPSGIVGLHIVKVFNDFGNWAYGSDLIAAIGQCTDAGATVINMSLGGVASSVIEREAFDEAWEGGVLSVAAAGNAGSNMLSYPASYDSVVSVAAINSDRSHAPFSQFNNQVELAAPGVAVNSTLPGNRYGAMNGTSMASPHVAGVAALVWSNHPECSNAEIRTVLGATAEDMGSTGRDVFFGHGIVKAKAASDYISENGCEADIEPPPPPSATELVDDVPFMGVFGGTNEQLRYVMDVPEDQTSVTFTISGGFGDADLYVRAGAEPDLNTYDCRPYRTGNIESCSFNNPTPGFWHVMLHGYTTFSGVTLMGDAIGESDSSGNNGVEQGLSGFAGDWKNRTVYVSASSSILTIETSGGTGDADLYVRFGAMPSRNAYDCRPYRWGNDETCTFNNPQPGTYNIGIRAYSDYSGLTYRWSFE